MAFSDGGGQFVNIERLLGEDMTHLPAILDSLQAVGVTGVRNFMCYSPDQGAAFGYWKDPTTVPSDARINTTLDAWAYIMSRGFKLIGGASDMNNAPSVTGPQQPMMAAHIANYARLVAARGFDPNRFAAEPVNEWAMAGSNGVADNVKTNPFRQAYFQVLRAALPLHTLVMAGDNYDYVKNSAGMWTPGPSDVNWLWMFHSYEDHNAGDWTKIIQGMRDIAAGAGVKALYGEFGNNPNAAKLSVPANVLDWQNDYWNGSQAAAKLGMIFASWAVTNGGALRLNADGGFALRPEAVASLKAAGGAWKTPAAAPAAPAAPAPAAPATSGTTSGTTSAAAPAAPASPILPAAPVVVVPAGPSLSFTIAQTATGVHLQVVKAIGGPSTLRISYTDSTGKLTYATLFEHVPDAPSAAPVSLSHAMVLPAGPLTFSMTVDGQTITTPPVPMVPYAPPPATSGTTSSAAPAPTAPVTSPVPIAQPVSPAVPAAPDPTTGTTSGATSAPTPATPPPAAPAQATLPQPILDAINALTQAQATQAADLAALKALVLANYGVTLP